MTDPRRSAVLVDVRLESLTGRPYKLYALLDPALSNTGDDDVGATDGRTLIAHDDKLASALVERARRSTRTSSGYLGTSDGWTDLRDDHRMDWTLRPRRRQGQRRPDRRAARDRDGRRPATRHARARLRRHAAGARRAPRARRSRGGFARAAAPLRRGLARLPRRAPAAAQRRGPRAALRRLGDGAGRRSRTRPTAARASRRRRWRGCGGRSPALRAVPPRLVARPLPGGDRADRGRRPRGRGARARLPVDAPAGARRLPPAELATSTARRTGRPAARRGRRPDPARLRSSGAATPATWSHVAARRRRASSPTGPTSQERWENDDGLLAGDDRGRDRRAGVRRRHRRAQRRRAPRPRATARWRTSGSARVAGWTRTTNGPLSSQPYYLRLTTDGNAERGHDVHDRRRRPDDRPARVVDTSFLELVRLGVKPRRRPRHPLDAARRRPRARRDDAERAVLAPLQLRRLRRDARRRPVPGPRQPRPAVAAASRASAASTSSPPGDRARGARGGSTRSPPPRAPGRMLPEQVWDDQPPPGATPGHGHAVGDPAGLDARAVHPPRLVDRRRAPGRAPERRRVPLRAALRLTTA